MLPENLNVLAPIDVVHKNEIEEAVNKVGSFLSIIMNKPISCVTFFTVLRKEIHLQQVLVDLTDSSWYDIVEYMSYRWPVLNKSKKIK
jgi:hypothetical protein